MKQPTRLKTGAITFLSCEAIPSTSLILCLSLRKMTHSPARMSASFRPRPAIQSAHAQAAAATSSTCTVWVGCLPGDHLQESLGLNLDFEIYGTHKVFIGFFI